MAFNVLAGMQYVQDQGKEGLEVRKQRDFNALTGQALTGDMDAQAQQYAIDPTKAGTISSAAEANLKTARGAAKYMQQAVQSGNEAQIQGAWQAVRPYLAKLGAAQGKVPDEQWTPAQLPMMEALLARTAYLDGGTQQRNLSVSPGSAIVDPATGQVIYERPFAPAKPQNATFQVDAQGNGWWLAPGQAPVPADMSSQPQQPQAQPQTGGASVVLDDALSNAVMMQESGGDPNAVSSAGARGLMQIMPETGRDPGFGIQPMRDNSPQENVRVGRDYLQAMLRKYNGNQQLALAAYNGGPGRVDRALQAAGGDPARAMTMLPQETQQYPGAVQARMGGQTAQAGGINFGKAPTPEKPTALQERIDTARALGASDDEIQRMVIGREGAAAGAKPMPAAALRMVTDANSALKEAATVNSTLESIREVIASDKLNLGPVRNVVNRGRVAAGMGNAESTRLSTMERSLRGLQNAALRLNKGVQTEGDAKRIWQELLGNLNDEASVLANIDRLMELNTRAQELHEMNLETINENYGRQGAQPAQPAPAQFNGFEVLD